MAGKDKKARRLFWLHDDVIFDILSYLPAKSMARFRSVSRSWRAMLSSAPFVQLHLRRANRPGQHKVFFHPDPAKETGDEHPGECNFYSWRQHGGPPKKLLREFTGGFASPATKTLPGLVLMYRPVYGHA